MPQPEILGVDDVMRRYGLRDRRSAGRSRRSGRPMPSRRSEPLPPGWWREEPGGDCDAA